MIKVKSGKIKIKDINFLENSRLRGNSDVADLMRDIEQRGLLENVGIRLSDNVLIYGNRRVAAFKKLNYDEISADFYDDLDDDELIIMNLAENIKRKNIGSIEIGRACQLLINNGLSRKEISQKLGITVTRVDSALAAFTVTKNTPFEDLVIFGNRGKSSGTISESIIWKIQNSLSRARRLTKEDWNDLLKAIENGEITIVHIAELRKVLLSDNSLTIKEAIKIMKVCKVIHMFFHFNEKKLNELMKDEKFTSETEFVRNIIKKYNRDLIF